MRGFQEKQNRQGESYGISIIYGDLTDGNRCFGRDRIGYSGENVIGESAEEICVSFVDHCGDTVSMSCENYIALQRI